MKLLLKSINSTNFVDVSNYLASGSKIGWYDVSKNSGRDVTNANGDMILNVVNDKWRIDIVTIPMKKNDYINFFSEIIKNPRMYAKFDNPYTGQEMTCLMYRGDRSSEEQQEYLNGDVLYKSATLAIIQL